MPDHRPIRVVSATRQRSGAVVFNQVAMLRAREPRGLLLVAVVPDEGLRMWMKPFSAIQPYTKSQVEGYSRNLRINLTKEPPEYLGEPVAIPAADVDEQQPGLWERIVKAQTNTKNKLVRELFGF